MSSYDYEHRFLEDEEQEPPPAIWEKIYTVAVLVIMFAALMSDRYGADSIMLAALIAFLASQIISIPEGLAGFSNTGLWTVLILFVVAQGIQQTGALDWYMTKLLGKPSSDAAAILRLMVPITIVSAFLNNTPIVVVMIPVILKWAQHANISPKQLLIPLSFASILGGTCTLIGTSTNLVVIGLLEQRYKDSTEGFTIGLFDMGVYGVPVAFIGIAYVVLCSPWLLPGSSKNSSNTTIQVSNDNILLGARVTQWSPAAGRTVQRSGLRDTGGVYLVSVLRATTGNIHRAVSRDFVLNAGDILYFTGLVESFGDFCSEHGLEVVAQEHATTKDSSLDEVSSIGVSSYKDGIEEVTGLMDDNNNHNNKMSSALLDQATVQLGTTLDSVLLSTNEDRMLSINHLSDVIKTIQDPSKTNSERMHEYITQDSPPKIIIVVEHHAVLIGIDATDYTGLMHRVSQELTKTHLQLHYTEAAVHCKRSLSVWRGETTGKDSDAESLIVDVWCRLKDVLSPNTKNGSRIVRAKITAGSRLLNTVASQVDFEQRYQASFLLNLANPRPISETNAAEKPMNEGDVLILLAHSLSPLLIDPPKNFYGSDGKTNAPSSFRMFGNGRPLSAVDDVETPQSSAAHELIWRDLQVVHANKESSTREFLTSMTVTMKSQLVGKSVQQVGINSLPGVHLVSIERHANPSQSQGTDVEAVGIPNVLSPRKSSNTCHAIEIDQPLKAGDILWFAGSATSISDLRKVPGLVSSQIGEVDKLNERVQDRRMVQAVVARNGPLEGKTIKELQFRTKYGAAVIAVNRDGNRLHELPGNISLHAGDVLLLEVGKSFYAKSQEHDRSFALLAEVANSAPPRMRLLVPALLITLAMLVVYTAKITSLLITSLTAAFLMVCSGILTEQEARNAINWDIFLTIGAAFGIGSAMINSGVAGDIAGFLVDIGSALGLGDAGLLGAVYFATFMISNVVTNNAAAALLFPVALDAAELAGIDKELMCYALMLGASASFMSPFGYTTNLLVYGAGGYRSMDFVYFGSPMQIVLWVCSTAFLVIRPFYLSWAASAIVLAVVVAYRLGGAHISSFTGGKNTGNKIT